MADQIQDEEHLELKEKLRKVRFQLLKLKANIHFLDLPEYTRSVLQEAFSRILIPDLAALLEQSEGLLRRWEGQVKLIADTKDLISAHNEMYPNKNLFENQDIVDAVLNLTKNTSPNLVARALDEAISQTSIRRWIRSRVEGITVKRVVVRTKTVAAIGSLDEFTTPKQSLDDIKVVTQKEINSEQPYVTIEESPDATKLASLLVRHEGKSRKKYSPMEKKLFLGLTDRFGAKEVHDQFKVSYDTLARLKRKRESGDEFGKPRIPLRYRPVLDLMNKHPGMGPMQMKDYIKRHMGLSMGVNSIRKVMEQNGWVPPYAKRSRIKTDIRFFEAVRKNYLWHLDFKHHYINQCKIAILLIQDDYSRFLVGHTFAEGENTDAVIRTVEESICIYGKPEMIMSDGGSAFYSWRGISQFSRILEDHGIDHYISKSANVNGKIESVCLQVEKEMLNTTSFASLKHFEAELSKWIGFYNFKRVHQGLEKLLVPADRYFPGAKQWYGEASEITRQQSLVAETMATLLNELKKPGHCE